MSSSNPFQYAPAPESREWVRSYTTPTHKKSAPETTPWLSIWMMPPWTPCGLRVNRPIVTIPMCATEE